jgi:hypothetical protein
MDRNVTITAEYLTERLVLSRKESNKQHGKQPVPPFLSPRRSHHEYENQGNLGIDIGSGAFVSLQTERSTNPSEVPMRHPENNSTTTFNHRITDTQT